MKAPRLEFHLFLVQRVSALILAVFILVHLIIVLPAAHGHLTAAEIVRLVRASSWGSMFYGVFVVTAASHAAIGARTLAGEWLGWRRPGRDLLAAAVWVALVALGLRAVMVLA